MFENIFHEFSRMKGEGRIVLFGSHQKGNARFDSDIDIAVISDDPGFIKRAEDVADKILFDYGRTVSVIRFSRVEFSHGQEPISKEIKKGRTLYEGDGH